MSGCATPERQSQSFIVKGQIEVIVVDQKALETIGDQNFGTPLRGFYFPEQRTIMVRYSGNKDRNGNNLPDFEALGHELYHALAGDFHKD